VTRLPFSFDICTSSFSFYKWDQAHLACYAPALS
jgi:hypothetical protein